MPTETDQIHALLRAVTPGQRHHINEMLTAAVAARVVQAGESVFDVGANSGFHTRHLSERVGVTGQVHAFEPNPMHWAGLLQFSNVRLWPFAVGDKCSVETFFAATGHDQSASLYDPRSWIGSNVDMHTLSVPQVPIDTLQEARSRPITFVKLDVEKHEYAALIGMRSLLSRDKPVIVLEGADTEIEAFLLEVGYRMYRLDHALFNGRGADAETVPVLPNTIFLDRSKDIAAVVPHREDVAALVMETTKLA